MGKGRRNRETQNRFWNEGMQKVEKLLKMLTQHSAEQGESPIPQSMECKGGKTAFTDYGPQHAREEDRADTVGSTIRAIFKKVHLALKHT